MRPTRWASLTIFSASRRTTSDSSSSIRASASRARAPTGVFSSWLMLATKSVRMASSRLRSVTSSMVARAANVPASLSTGTAVTTTVRLGGPYSSSVWRRWPPVRAMRRWAPTASSTSTSAWRTPRKWHGRLVAQDARRPPRRPPPHRAAGRRGRAAAARPTSVRRRPWPARRADRLFELVERRRHARCRGTRRRSGSTPLHQPPEPAHGAPLHRRARRPPPRRRRRR